MCQFILCFFRQLAQTTYLYLNLSHIFPNKVNLSNTYTYYKRWFSVIFKIPLHFSSACVWIYNWVESFHKLAMVWTMNT